MKKRILYFDCFAGIAGDMTVAALLDLGVNFPELKSKLEELPVRGYQLNLKKVLKHGISAQKFDVHLDKNELKNENHSHDHAHRNLSDITKIIKESSFSEKVKKIALEMFMHVAIAEAKVHNKQPNEIHFHEVGAIDSIIDILGAAYCFDVLNIDEVYSSPISYGKGFVHCAHGKMPVPVPATLEILSNVPVKYTEISGELTTPTGAAIIKTLATRFEKPDTMNILRTGYGAGTRDREIPNLVRISLAEIEEDSSETEKLQNENVVYELVTNIDDMNPEIYSYLFEILFEKGALDVWLENIVMKKNRPGQKLVVLCKEKNIAELEEVIFRETTTFGIRKRKFERTELERKFEKVETELGEITVKVGFLNGKEIKRSPEFEDCKRIAKSKNVPIKDIYNLV